jgi:hypothetical protein
VQTQILERFPGADLSVYVVWLPVLPLDNNRVSVTETVTDDRATHFWDNERTVSDVLATAYGNDGGVLWDAVFVFVPGAKWGSTPPIPEASGAPVVDAISIVERTLKPYLT